MKCFFSPLAEFDLEEIGDYIARDNPERAVSFIGEIRDLCKKLTATPEAFPLRPELGEGLRMARLKAYLIFYTVTGQSIRIERILHGARDISSIFDS